MNVLFKEFEDRPIAAASLGQVFYPCFLQCYVLLPSKYLWFQGVGSGSSIWAVCVIVLCLIVLPVIFLCDTANVVYRFTARSCIMGKK